MIKQRRLLIAVVGAAIACGGDGPTAPPIIYSHPVGTLTARVIGLTGRPFGVRVSASDVVLATLQDANSVVGFDINATNPAFAVPAGNDPGDVVFSADGSRAFASAFNSGGLHVIDVAGHKQLAVVQISSNAYRLALASDHRLFVTTTGGKVYVVDPTTPAVLDSATLSGSLQAIALSKSAADLFVASVSGGVWRLNPGTLQIVTSRTMPDRFQDIAVAPDGSEIYLSDEFGGIEVLDAATLATKQRITTSAFGPFGLALSPDGAHLYVTSPQTGNAKIFDRVTRAEIATLATGGMPRRVAFDLTGKTAVIANESNWVDIVR